MIKVAKFSRQGGREINEDGCSVVGGKNAVLVMAADGLGGCGGGKLAAQKAMEIVKEEFLQCNQTSKELLGKWFERANQEIIALQENGVKMKTTLTALVVNEKNAVWAHMGDTRLYYFADNKQEFVTFDHSVTQMAVLRGEINRDEMRHHEDRNRLIKVLGMNEVDAEISELCLLKEVRHAFLLCTDGFWEYVTEDEMENCLKTSEDPKEWLQHMREILEEQAGEKNDNYTAAAVWIN